MGYRGRRSCRRGPPPLAVRQAARDPWARWRQRESRRRGERVALLFAPAFGKRRRRHCERRNPSRARRDVVRSRMVEQPARAWGSWLGLALPSVRRRRGVDALSDAARKRRSRAEFQRNLDRARWNRSPFAGCRFSDDAGSVLEKQREWGPLPG